jgi:murein DD-endopeptidase MepM/ murein hydrolase activator NlpD
MGHARLSIAETFGLSPWRSRLREAALLFRGDPTTPKTRFDHTSLRQMTRLPGWRMWMGARPYGRRIPISNLFNHEQSPPEDGWSVRITRVRDFRGRDLTYDSHNGTDFATPIGTPVVAAAPGVVLRVSREFNRGGLKIFIDHGGGIVSTSNHLGRALVEVGDRVGRGDVIALSGYSGLDGLATFPWGIPHVHFNVWLDGSPVDPFARPDELALWRGGNAPTPHAGDTLAADAFEPTAWNDAAITRAIAACISDASRSDIAAITDRDQRAMAVLFHLNYYPTRFRERPMIYARTHPRRPVLDLPFLAADYDGVQFPDDV